MNLALSPERGEAAALYAAGEPFLLATRRINDLETPLSAFLKLGAGPGACLLESVEGGETLGRYSIIGLDPDLVWRVRDGVAEQSDGGFADADFTPLPQPPLQALATLIAHSQIPIGPDAPPMAAGLFGYLGYDMIRYVEHLPNAPPNDLNLPEAVLMRPRVVAVFDAVKQEVLLAAPVRPLADLAFHDAYSQAAARLQTAIEQLAAPLPAAANNEARKSKPISPKSAISPKRYREMVARVKEYARAGDIFQVVPSQRFEAPFALPSTALYRALRRLNPSPFLFHFNFDAFQIVGSSPEILVRVRDRAVTIRPIAGTRPRGQTPAQDKALEEELLADPKERAEHLMLLDLGRNDVGRVAATARESNQGGVRVTAQFTIERYSHVMHIVSNVEGRLKPGLTALDALFAGFPAGTVSGAPKVRAMEIIDELEPTRRGVYAGAVGYFSAAGDMDMCIALRTAVLKDSTMYVQAGGGVVLDSDPEAELQETVNKSRALFRAAEEAWRFA